MYNQQVRFGPPVTPNVIKQIMIVNVAVFVMQRLAPVVGVPTGPVGIPRPFDSLTRWCAAWPEQFWTQGTLWQPFTYMFLHADLMHIGFNMLALWMFGSPLAAVWGERRFLRFYLAAGLGAGLIIVTWPGIPVLFGGASSSFYYPTLGASGAVFGVLLAYSLTWPNRTIMLLFPPIPMKAIYFIPFILAIEFLSPSAANISHVGHLGGVAAGWILFRRMSGQSLIPSLGPLKLRWRRWRMRRKLRAVRMDEQDRWRRSNDDDWTVH